MQQSKLILLEKRIPLPAPNHLDDIPSCTTENTFQLLDNLAIASDRAIQSLQITIDNKNQVIQLLSTCQCNRTLGLRLIHFTIASKAPDFSRTTTSEASIVQILHDVCLVDCLQWAQPHRNRWELPVVRHQPGVRIGRQAISIHFLAKFVELFFGQAPFKERPGVNTRRGVALYIDQVTQLFLGCPTEEIVKTNVVKGRARLEAGNMTA